MATEFNKIAINSMLNFFSVSIDHAEVVINGETKRYPIHDTRITDGVLRKYVYLQGDEVGEVQRATLMDINNMSWVSKDMEYIKGKDGHIIVFPIELKAIIRQK